MNEITLIVPYYRNPKMLLKQEEYWQLYPPELKIIVVDDGSPEDPADEVLSKNCPATIYRIDTDIPWNRNGARNVGTYMAITEWVLHIDIDHILYPGPAFALLQHKLNSKHWYRFDRYRIGAADETRKKDTIPIDQTFGKIKSHIDSYLCRRELYWEVGGYDEDYSGSLGGSAPFLKKMTAAAKCETLDLALMVFTRHEVSDASDIHLSRDRTRYEKIRREKAALNDPKPTTWMRFPWHKVR